MASRLRNNKDIKGFQIKIDEKTHSIKISQLADPNVLIGFSYHLMPSMLSLLCLSFPTQIPPVLFLFINNPEKDPKVSISTLLFVLSVEIMASRLRNNKDIKGFQIKIDEKTHSIKISQLADDTTLFCTSKEEIYLAFNEIETFGSFSGLLMNKYKTGGIWVGKLKHSKDKIEGIPYHSVSFNFVWFTISYEFETITFNLFSIFVWHDTCTSNKSKYRYD
jgi:hypothetical protein